jgi:hypothetical protein
MYCEDWTIWSPLLSNDTAGFETPIYWLISRTLYLFWFGKYSYVLTTLLSPDTLPSKTLFCFILSVERIVLLCERGAWTTYSLTGTVFDGPTKILSTFVFPDPLVYCCCAATVWPLESWFSWFWFLEIEFYWTKTVSTFEFLGACVYWETKSSFFWPLT